VGSIPFQFAEYITQHLSPPRSSFLPASLPCRRPPLARAQRNALRTHFFLFYLRPIHTSLPPSLPFSLDPYVSGQMDRYLRRRLTRSIMFHNQSPTTAAPPTPIGDDTHKALLTVQHDDDYTLCIHVYITGLEAGAYAYGCCFPP